MITIETFCHVCRESVDIPVADEDVEGLDLALMTRVGVTCNRCADAAQRKRNELWGQPISRDNLNAKPKRKRPTSSPHNDP